MKIIYLAIYLSAALSGCSSAPAFAMDRFAALSMIESGDDDSAVGQADEVSRYQILPYNWTHIAPLIPISNATDPFFSKMVAVSFAFHLQQNFESRRHRAPTDFEFYKLWNPHCPDEIASRFANLCNRK